MSCSRTLTGTGSSTARCRAALPPDSGRALSAKRLRPTVCFGLCQSLLLLALACGCGARTVVLARWELGEDITAWIQAPSVYDMSVPCKVCIKHGSDRRDSVHIHFADPSVLETRRCPIRVDRQGGLLLFVEEDSPTVVLAVYSPTQGFLYPEFGRTDPYDYQRASSLLESLSSPVSREGEGQRGRLSLAH